MLDRPIFVVGCGRSGTTLLGTAIGAHSQVAYLNEPREIWEAALPQSDIWSSYSLARDGRIGLGLDDWSPEIAERLRDLFEKAIARKGATRLCEKLPINAFRLPLIARIFPDAYFVYIERNGVDVAKSIARRIEAGKWFGTAGRKWHLLVEVAEAEASTRGIARDCNSPFQKGLLEWFLSTVTARRFFEHQPNRTVAIGYDELFDSPEAVGTRIEVGCDLLRSGEPARYLKQAAVPKHSPPQECVDDLARNMLIRWSETVAATPGISSKIRSSHQPGADHICESDIPNGS